MSDRREADWGSVPDLHLVTSKTTFSQTGSILRPHSRALGATPSYPGHDATNGLKSPYHVRHIRMQHNHVALITGYPHASLAIAKSADT